MAYLIITLGAILMVAGFVFCFVPAISGPLVSFLGLALLRILGDHTVPSWTILIVSFLLMLFAIAVDYVAPLLGARAFKASKRGMVGSFIGTIVGLFFFPWGLLIGPFTGAFLGELLAHRKFLESLKGALGAFLGYAAGLGVKLISCSIMAFWFVWALIK